MSTPLDHIRFFLKVRRAHARVEYPLRNVRAANRVEIGHNVRIRKHAWFSLTPACRVSIGDNTRLGRHLVLAGAGTSIVIEENVLVSERVLIAECNHGFRDVSRPVLEMPVVSAGPVRIGAGSWLGMGVCVLPNVTIGKHCIIGANAVVTSSIPDYCVAVGVPARVSQRYDFEKEHWVSAASQETG
jgi:acetyltransferase-like isoleucine patch superfamily enzyme